MLIPDFVVTTKAVQIGTSTGLILGGNPDRFSLLWWPRSVGNYVIGPSPQVNSGQGFAVNFNGSYVMFSFADLGPIVCGDWYGVNTGGPITAWVSECVYRPRKE